MNISSKIATTPFLRHILRRTLTRSSKLGMPGAYEGEGKTTAHIMNTDEDFGLMINGYSQVGFRLNNNMTVLGPMIIFSRSILSWNIADISDVNEESLSLFKVLEPKLDIIVLGTGDQLENHNFFAKLLTFSKKFKISFEILPTYQACPTFNFLNAEGRNVVGAMIPPATIKITDDDEFQTKLRYQNLYEAES